MKNSSIRHSSSFRDPAGFIFKSDGTFYRQINREGKAIYTSLMASGLYKKLSSQGLLIPHEEIDSIAPFDPNFCYKVIFPRQLRIVSYPYEWCFSQLKDAALLILKIQSIALEHGLTLKDASAYNVQFEDGRPVFIDTLSFEHYREGRPWIAYHQFCKHFLAPIALMSKVDCQLNLLMRDFIDGIPIPMASSILNWKSRLSLPLLLHIHLHSLSQKRYSGKISDKGINNNRFSKHSLMGLIDNLQNCIKRLKYKLSASNWANYYSHNNYTEVAADDKADIIQQYLVQIRPKSLWDLGGNIGRYSRIAARMGIDAVCFDSDHDAIDRNYLLCKKKRIKNLLPLVLNLTNPSPNMGWNSTEREGIIRRGPADCVMALALIHHLVIGNNIPFSMLSSFLSDIAKYLIIEFVPKNDSQVKRLLHARDDIFPKYTKKMFEASFSNHFIIEHCKPVLDSHRHLYLMRRK